MQMFNESGEERVRGRQKKGRELHEELLVHTVHQILSK
jgi:hypothetical protein